MRKSKILQKWKKITITSFVTIASSSFLIVNNLLVSCKKEINKEKIALDFQKQKQRKLDSNFIDNNTSIFLQTFNNSINDSLNFLQKQKPNFVKNLETNDIIFNNKNKNELNAPQEEQHFNEEESKLFEEFLKQEKINKSNVRKYKIITASFIVVSSVITGVAVGLGAYFGFKNINSSENIRKRELEEKLENYRQLLKNISPTNSLVNVFNKMFELAFTNQLPKAVLRILKETFFKDLLQDFDEKSEDILTKKLEGIKNPTKEIFRKFYDKTIVINLLKNDSETSIKKAIKDWVVEIVKEYLPKAFKSIIEFLITQSETGKKSSIMSRFIEGLLFARQIKIKDIENFSNVVSIFAKFFTNQNSQLFEYIITSISNAINKHDFSFDILNDFFEIINLIILDLTAKDGKIDIEKVINTLLPKITSIVNIDANSDYSSYVKFINDLFTKDVYQNNKWVYYFMSTNKITSNAYIYLDSDFKSVTHKIKFPEFNINFETIVEVFENRKNISDNFDKLMNLIFEPLIIQLTKKEKNDSVKKAIFRLATFLSFVYYKYAKVSKKNWINAIFNRVNPYEPISYLPKIIDNLINKHKNLSINLDSIFGEKFYRHFSFKNYYKIFDITIDAAKGEIAKLKEILEVGYYK
ncbi:hypothetical protein QLQ80_00265 [Mycoplasma sp. M5725]|uniref:Transmembrane protein n=1 Tax=Mycoplasma phocimorsus TaxID=3045839 RepID=A0AAJ1PRI9_9MOLU|nr:hypothetical protein [Mycoplasma phocimorsus]MDJ1645526.1 hypothetical protein [Mycoplasma phocimorsus]